MPFVQGAGLAVFVPPAEDEIKAFEKSLSEGKELTSEYKDQSDVNFQSLLLERLTSYQRLSDSNNAILNSINALSKKNFGVVDIILPIYNNLQIVEPCLAALLRRTNWPFNLILVDDASNSKTVAWLQALVEENPSITLLRNNTNRGFAASVNRGMKAGSNPYICLLNSDVIVTNNWLTKMVFALESNPRNKIVNPCTNNTAEIAVPMKEGASYLDMAMAINASSSHRYPEIMPTGFCMMFERETINTIGYFDEGYGSYGEETDFWMRVITHTDQGEYVRWRAVLADDTYVFHERGSSFASIGEAKQMSLRRSGNERFKSIWPQYSVWRNNFNLEESMGPVRASLNVGISSDSLYRVAFIVHSVEYCGGMRFITDIVNSLMEKNIEAKIVLLKRDPSISVKPLGELRTAPIIFDTPLDLIENFETQVFSNGIVFAGTNELVPIITALTEKNPRLIPALFAQSAEPLMASDLAQHEMFLKSYDQVNYIITVSNWLKEYIEQASSKHKKISYVNPGVDTRLFYPRDRSKGDDRPTLLLALNNTAPYRGVERGIEMAEALIRLAKRRGTELRVLAYGVVSVKGHQDIVCLGKLSQARLAEVIGTEVDVFCDPARLHSYGMPALEAIASNIPAVCWDNKGVHSVIKHEENGLIFSEGASVEQVAAIIYKLLMNEDGQRDKFVFSGVKIRENAVNEFIYILENELGVYSPPRRINIITPHLRKYGGPTTILNLAHGLQSLGHDVTLYTIYSDLNPEIIKDAKVPIHVNWKEPKEADITIINSDNEHTEFFAKHPSSTKKVMLKLSHNPRFKALEEKGLQQEWDAIITSTNWLKKVCNNPTDEWNYPPREAHRIGWVHYAHSQFNCPPENKAKFKTAEAIIIGTLIHAHPLKGTAIAIEGLLPIVNKYTTKVIVTGVGEVPKEKVSLPPWLKYMYNLNRKYLANLMAQTDIWVVASQSEGLGRLALEAMSAGCAVIITETDAEFAKNGENCIVVPCNDSQAIASAVDNLITDSVLREKIQQGGYETACEFADQTNYIGNINNILQGLFK